MSQTLHLEAEEFTRGVAMFREGVSEMKGAAMAIEAAFAERRRWEEEYLRRIEAVVDRELAFYGTGDGK